MNGTLKLQSLITLDITKRLYMLQIQETESRIIKLSRNVLDIFRMISLIRETFVKRISKAAESITLSFHCNKILSNGTKMCSISSRITDPDRFSLRGMIFPSIWKKFSLSFLFLSGKQTVTLWCQWTTVLLLLSVKFICAQRSRELSPIWMLGCGRGL